MSYSPRRSSGADAMYFPGERGDRRIVTEELSDEDLEGIMELRKLQKMGIFLQLNGYPATPEKLIRTGVMHENSNYMREYLPSPEDDSLFQTINFGSLESKPPKEEQGNRKNNRSVANRSNDRNGSYKGRC